MVYMSAPPAPISSRAREPPPRLYTGRISVFMTTPRQFSLDSRIDDKFCHDTTEFAWSGAFVNVQLNTSGIHSTDLYGIRGTKLLVTYCLDGDSCKERHQYGRGDRGKFTQGLYFTYYWSGDVTCHFRRSVSASINTHASLESVLKVDREVDNFF
ncbi:hypothetical protein AVEN_10624-1 [Araneus ventricosus]|uniref:Uncharacterized protein n=1 Tax=Araneus ventricosus TaxID=182803 RepID=A0A4Y2ISA8_ARAVE|nr:hypothetical protein AVEN_10624-1 [Araneus ventricosus]